MKAALFDMDGVDIAFTKDALEAIAEKSLERKTGARGLRAIMENVMMDDMYNVPSDDSVKTLEITREKVEANLLLIEKKPEVLSIEEKKDKKESA